jgi:KaiC/GvpD/RAD55 family RecA-like ATPase
MTIAETFNATQPVFEFLFDNDALEILLNNLTSFSERVEDIVNLTSDVKKYGTEKHKHYLSYLQLAIEFQKQNQRFPNLDELNKISNLDYIPKRDENYANEAYLEITGIVQEEKRIAEFRSALRSKDEARIVDFAKNLLPSTPLPEISIDKILDIKTLRRKGRENKSTIVSGIQIFDNITYGFRNKTINTISAPSSGGKTTFAVNMAYNNALKGNLVVYCALESSAEEILSSLISLAYKRKQKEDTSFLCEEFKLYKESFSISGLNPGTVNSIKFYQLSQEVDDLLVDNYQHEITKTGGNIYVIDDSNSNLRSVQTLTATIDSIAQKEGRRVDVIVIDNADELTSFEAEDKSDADMTMVNKMINQLNSYTTTHFNGQGTMILFLAQLNRAGINELAKEKPDLNLTHISTYSNLYTKASIVAALSVNKKKNSVLELRILKNRHGKKTGNEEPKYMIALFEFCYIEDDNVNVEVSSKDEMEEDLINSSNDGEDISDITLGDDDEFETSDMVI